MHLRRSWFVRVIELVSLASFISLLSAQPADGPAVQATRIRVDESLIMDGRLDEEAWRRASPATDFRQRDPLEGELATEQTEVRILYDSDTLFLGVICYDSEPQRIRAKELRRDDPLENDDTFAVLFDTYHDHRNAFVFRTNPQGTRFDAIITDEDRNMNIQWDEKWSSNGRITDEGWVVEIRIPLKSLRSHRKEQQTWGVNFERVIRRKNERTYWTGYGRDYEFWNVSQAGRLDGLENIRTGLKLRLKPYGLGGVSNLRKDEDVPETYIKNESQVGFEDVKVSITPSITADFTVNPDFAQADIDQAQVNLTRFSLFFPEKREFFLEGAGIFEFGTASQRFGFRPPEVIVFYSRRIGLDDEEQIPILAGAKVTGDTGGFQFGVLNTQTRTKDDVLATNYGVYRVKKKLLRRSYVGGIFTNKAVSDDGGFNRVGGFDGSFVLFDKMVLSGFFAASDSGLSNVKNKAYQLSGRWNSDLLDVDLERTRIDEDFDPEIGFVLREGVIKHRGRVAWKPRTSLPWIQQFWLSTTHQWYTRQEGFLESRENEAFFGFRSLDGDFMGIGINSNYENLDEPFEIHPDYEIPAGTYNFTQGSAWARLATNRSISGVLRAEFGEFYDGSIKSFSLGPLIKVNRHFSVEMTYIHNQIDISTGSFNADVINSRFNYNLTNRFLTSTAVQYDNISDEFNLNVRFNYIYRPGDDLFIVYNEGRDYDNLTRGLMNRTLLVKFTHSFDF